MLQDKSGVLPKLWLGFGGGEVVEGGADEAGAVSARRLGGLQFVAQRQQLLHLRHNPPCSAGGGTELQTQDLDTANLFVS